MKKAWVSIAAVVILLAGLAGCKTARTYSVEKPRTDLDIQGNRGYLMGEPTGEPPANRLGTTRKISVLEIELPDARKAKKAAPATSAAPVVEGQKQEEAMVSQTPSEEETGYVEEQAVPATPQSSEEYVVQKYDTLQKISFKFYGTTKKWKYLYDVNKDAIKNPDKLYPGMKLVVPSLK